MTLTIIGLIFETIGAITLIYSIFIKKKIDFINEASYHNEMIWCNGEFKELNINILENNITTWKNNYVGLIYFIIGFIFQIIGQDIYLNYSLYCINWYFQGLIFILIPLIFVLFEKLKTLKTRKIIIDYFKKYSLDSLGLRGNEKKRLLKYFPACEHIKDLQEYLNSIYEKKHSNKMA